MNFSTSDKADSGACGKTACRAKCAAPNDKKETDPFLARVAIRCTENRWFQVGSENSQALSVSPHVHYCKSSMNVAASAPAPPNAWPATLAAMPCHGSICRPVGL
jgi:hypothetical protein